MAFNGETYDIYGERNYMSNYMIIICYTHGNSMFNRQLTAIVWRTCTLQTLI